MPESVYTRRLSSNERLYLVAEKLNPGFCIQIVIEGEGFISAHELRIAIDEASRVNPGSRLVLRGVLGWSRWVACGPTPRLRLLSSWLDDDSASYEIAQPLSPVMGPTCEVVYSPPNSLSGIYRLVFRCFHGVMDARGLLHFAEEVFRQMRGEKLVGADSTLSDTELAQLLGAKRKRPALKSKYLPLTQAGDRRDQKILWRRVAIDGTFPALVSKLAVALVGTSQQGHSVPVRLMVPVDLRNYQRDLLSTGNLTYPLFLDVTAEQSWQEVQKKILSRLAAREPIQMDQAEFVLPWLPLWLTRAGYVYWIRGHRRTGRFPVSVLLSHLSLRNRDQLSAAGFRCTSVYFLPQQLSFVPLCVSVVSDSNSSQVVISGPRDYLSPDELGRFEEKVREVLSHTL